MINMIIKHKQTGFTLIETLLYVTLSSIIIAVVFSTMTLYSDIQESAQIDSKLIIESQQIVRVIEQDLRSANAINAVSASTIEYQDQSGLNSQLQLNGSDLIITKDGNSTVLNSNQTSVTAFTPIDHTNIDAGTNSLALEFSLTYQGRTIDAHGAATLRY